LAASLARSAVAGVSSRATSAVMAAGRNRFMDEQQRFPVAVSGQGVVRSTLLRTAVASLRQCSASGRQRRGSPSVYDGPR
jgi:hypothetical protein